QVDVEVLQDVGRDPGAFLDQAQEDVLGADVLVVEALRLLIGQLHHLACPICKTFIHFQPSPRLPTSEVDHCRPPFGRGMIHDRSLSTLPTLRSPTDPPPDATELRRRPLLSTTLIIFQESVCCRQKTTGRS